MLWDLSCHGNASTFAGGALRRSRRQRGFTLVELVMAMSFVALLAVGIVFSISTSLNVWKQLTESSDLNQEARAITEMVTHDLRNCYMGLFNDVGFFSALPAQEGQAPFDSVAFTTGSSSVSRAALLPDQMRSNQQQQPITDYIGVRYEWSAGENGQPAGLYRTTWPVPGVSVIAPAAATESPNTELISHALTRFELRYFDGTQWSDEYDARDYSNRPPVEIQVRLVVRDEHNREHEFQTLVSTVHD
ncbi:MAG: prepilin-type N-terminal cleavage/methylation domain-containing protein [Armatimonadota bacterium]|jgi:prepilin-type N-terminal cleavage/methylation domain-containing protein